MININSGGVRYATHDNSKTVEACKQATKKMIDLAIKYSKQDQKMFKRYKELQNFFEDELTPVELMEYQELKKIMEPKIQYKLI